jgi:nucleotide-binding universal stress UspA family protein
MITHILTAVDGSEFSVRASRLGAEIMSGRSEGTLTLLYIAQTKSGLEWYQGPGTDLHQASKQEREALEGAFKNGQAHLAEARNVCQTLLKGQKVRLETLVVMGDPAQKIVEQAGKSGCDLIILGSRGATPLRGALIGSVSQKVLANSPYPVLIVK